MAWKDNKVVNFMSTFVDALPKDTIKQASSEITCPFVVKNYNQHMGGVDTLDAYVGRYITLQEMVYENDKFLANVEKSHF